MITYNDIYEALRKEKYSEQLQPLPKKFICDVSVYISEKKNLSRKGDDLFSEDVMKVKKQLENALSIFNELMMIRKRKILNLVFVASETGISKKDFENMMDFEKELFDNIIDSVKVAEKKLSFEFSGGDLSSGKEIQNDMLLFLEDVEELTGLDGETIGPFSKGEVVNVPKAIASILVESKKAEFVN
jgi:DNA replication initiation complex subunit (GINS family)